MTVPRRLAAILVADVVGYSGMMGADETGTVDFAEGQRIVFHMGINVGDVVFEGEDLCGDGSTSPRG